jgi:uroporphyrinogen decarboxylase
MTHRERILTALKRQEPDMLPIDFGGTLASTINLKAYEALRDYLKVDAGMPPHILSTRAATVFPSETILRRFDVDTRMVMIGAAERSSDRQISEDAFVDEWGVTCTRHGGHFINTDGPFYHLDEPTLNDLEKYEWPDPADPGRYRGLRDRARALHENTDYAVIFHPPALGPVQQGQFLRGFSQWMEDLLLRPVFFEGLMDRVTNFHVEVITRAMDEAGEYMDVVHLGDDLSNQAGPLFRVELYRRLMKPYHKRLVDLAKQHGKAAIYHCCGAAYPFIPDFIDMGFDGFNPVQVSAAGMDTKRLKREFGRDIAFWGGIDTQSVLPRGTPADVRKEVETRIEDLAGGGGYVLASVHNIQAEVPPQNVAAMLETALEFRQNHVRA